MGRIYTLMGIPLNTGVAHEGRAGHYNSRKHKRAESEHLAIKQTENQPVKVKGRTGERKDQEHRIIAVQNRALLGQRKTRHCISW